MHVSHQVAVTVSHSLDFNGHIPGGHGLAGTRTMAAVVTTGAVRRAKLQISSLKVRVVILERFGNW